MLLFTHSLTQSNTVNKSVIPYQTISSSRHTNHVTETVLVNIKCEIEASLDKGNPTALVMLEQLITLFYLIAYKIALASME
jgi:hypothetical protein